MRKRSALVASALLVLAIDGTPAAPNPERAVTDSFQDSQLVPVTPVEGAVKEAFRREFDELIEHPALFDDPRSVNCPGMGHYTATAYLRASATTSNLLSLYLSPGTGAKVTRKTRANVLTPAGRFRVLVVLVRHPATMGDTGLAGWERAQEQINEEHRAFARSRGYPAAIVTFDNTNLIVERPTTAIGALRPSVPASVRIAARQEGFPAGDYQIVISIDIDPEKLEGGVSINAERFIHVGNFGGWKTALTPEHWLAVARTAYHHEMAHQWGWPATHDWSGTCTGEKLFDPFIVSPLLLGWEDVDGDRVPEILDETPYGRSRDAAVDGAR